MRHYLAYFWSEPAGRHSLFAYCPIAGLILGSVLLLNSCSRAPQPVTAVEDEQFPQVTIGATGVSASADVPEPPIVTSLGETPVGFPSFAPPRPEEIVTMTPTPAATATPSPTAAVDGGIHSTEASVDTDGISTPGATKEPVPTFTPPATPDESSDDHYWLQRPVGAGGVVWTDKHYPYGSTRGGELRPHHGVEFNVPYNTPILAAASGTVVVAGADSEVAYGAHTNFYGNLVVIEHTFQYAGQAVFTLYGHLNEVHVNPGQQVSAQEVLGLSGATGVADGPHMHFEVRMGINSYDSTHNPLLWLYPFPGRGTVAGRVTWPDGTLTEGAPVSLNRIDGPSPYYGSTTYSGSTVNADYHWGENFAIDDVVAGYYQVTVRAGDDKYTVETWVFPYRTSFVEMVIQQ